MSKDNFSQSYSSEKVKVSPNALYLDPNNVRNITSLGAIKNYSGSELTSDRLQNELWQYMFNSPKAKIKALADSIKSNGWINFAGRFLVEEIDGQPGKYLVLEGNRRTTTLKYILKSPSAFGSKIIQQINKVEVDLLHVNPGTDRDFVVQILKGFTNTSGIVLFDAMNQAFNTYIAYMQKFSPRRTKPFRYVNDIAKKIAPHLGLGTKTVKKHLGIVQVYEQIRADGHEITPDRFTLIENAIQSAKLKRDYFGYDDSERCALEFSDEGVQRWANLCLKENAPRGKMPPIHKPRHMNDFAHIFDYTNTYGDPSLQRSVETHTKTIEQATLAMKKAKAPDKLAGTLKKVLNDIGELTPGDYRGTRLENDLISELEKKLAILKGMRN